MVIENAHSRLHFMTASVVTETFYGMDASIWITVIAHEIQIYVNLENCTNLYINAGMESGIGCLGPNLGDQRICREPYRRDS